MRRKIQWHSLSIKEVAKLLKTDVRRGLLEKEVKPRQKEFGLNKLPEEKPLSKLRIFFEQFKSPLIYILLIAGVVTLILQEYTDSIVIFLAVFINATFGFFEENKASKTLRTLKKILKVKTIVLRDGNKKEVLQEEIVPGDIIILNPGDKVPADGRLIETNNLKINEAILTGEWLPASKTTKSLPRNVPLTDRDNMVYMGTTIEDGQGKAIVTEIGKNTEMGKIATLIKVTKEEKTPLQKKLARFSKVIGILIGIICLFIFLGGAIKGLDLLVMFETSVAIAVGGIPEALPIVMVVVLSLGMERILKRKGLIRKLASVETLGSTSVICTDKTKTLTEGRMEIGEIITKNEKLTLEIATLTSEVFIENPQTSVENWIV
ncbi:MAG: HAD-IC family P-type ATPase, partial [Methanosarcinales archaeon]